MENVQKNILPLNYLHFVDGMFGIHLMIIALADLFFKGNYIGYELLWKNNIMCKISSVIALISMMLSPIVLCIMVFARYCVIQWPITSKFKNKTFVDRFFKISLIIAIFPCIFLISGIFGIYLNHVPTGICLLLYISKDYSLFLLLTSLAVICSQIICLLLMLILTILSITKVINTESALTLKSKDKKSVKVMKHLIVAIFTNMCCWIPSSGVFISILIGHKMSSHLLGWITVVIVPINSVLDPLLFTILTQEMRRNVIKIWNQSKGKVVLAKRRKF